ncbi:(2Fe-2S)-binding protein [Oceanicella sp. SM1341]|uniref:(2Fe-2S)-binding protein n=1 Tax=Oceanicella sp. SM1341 TaxID=1548889 RepID=UPI000E4F1431|nr:(2Fe-2S)-binding protein [Oceanicella sp. SM1341]
MSASARSQTIDISLTVNGRPVQASVEPRLSLLDFLREELDLTGAKKGCNRGECGTCTVLVDGRRVNSCLVLAASASNHEVVTVEGLAKDGELHPVQQAFIEADALQCGFCTSGQIISAVACIEEGHAGSTEEIREWMSGNLCRCSCYPQIAEAVEMAARRMEADNA